MFKRIITAVSTWASLAGLAWMFHQPGKPLTWPEGLVMGVCICLLAYWVLVVVQDYSKTKSFDKGDKTAINTYMYAWISKADRVAIFTRDMTWAHEPRIKDLLASKAGKDELSVFLPKHIPISEELRGMGASVYTYSDLEIDPTSRFTIINYGKGDAQVAIGRTYENKHVVEEFAAGTHPVFHVVMDLIEVLKCIHKRNAART